MSLVEVGRFARNEAYIVVGRLESEGIMALALDGNASIADGSQFFIPVRVMVDDDDVDGARAILAESA
ncbi:putative signal transducing protein [Sphingomonas sp. PWP1-2]|uniref:putative signal transducing protein n=1 Tax=Sphingomonas sp. PWP1-2 TaxID=2804558 RepID=UPI003CF1104E